MLFCFRSEIYLVEVECLTIIAIPVNPLEQMGNFFPSLG